MVEICENKKLSSNSLIVMELSEDGNVHGSSSMEIKGDWAYLLDMVLEDDYDFFPMYDGLVRSTINKALHRGISFFAFPLSKEKYQYLSKNRFIELEDNIEFKYVDIEEFFSRGCCGGK